MAENECQGPGKCGWVESERLLAKTFDAWRAEFRTILEDHRRDIQNRLETIERRIEQKSECARGAALGCRHKLAVSL